MSFYVTLPSNSSMEFYPNNTMTRYTTKLKTSLNLEGKYQVGLVEIMYPVNWRFKSDGTITSSTIVNGIKNEVKCKVQFYANDTLEYILNYVNSFFKKEKQNIEFKFNVLTKNVSVTLGPLFNVSFTKEVADAFGFSTKNFGGAKAQSHTFFGDKKVNSKINDVSTFYVYSDIAEFQAVGDESAQLLRVVAVENNEFVDKIYDSPHYVDVIRNNIETIEIDIRTDTGEPILFNPGKVMIKLHFKRKNNFY